MTSYDYNLVAKHLKLFINNDEINNHDKNTNNNSNIDLKKKVKDNCGICLEKINNNTRLPCKHEYCYDCIKRWTEMNKRTCPLCRSSFDKYINDNIITTLNVINKEKEKSQNIILNRQVEVCYYCGLGGRLLICDNCEGSYGFLAHIRCAGFDREDTPEQDWFCMYCR